MQLTAEMIKELRKELNEEEIDFSKLYNFKNKSSRLLSLKLKKKNFILPTEFPRVNQELLNDMRSSNDLKTIFKTMKTILEKAGKVPTRYKIKAPLDTQIEKN